jgi:hypothetical protein
MFRKTETPLLGVVENMAWFEEPSTGARIPIFGEGGARAEAVRLGRAPAGGNPLETPPAGGLRRGPAPARSLRPHECVLPGLCQPRGGRWPEMDPDAWRQRRSTVA